MFFSLFRWQERLAAFMLAGKLYVIDDSSKGHVGLAIFDVQWAALACGASLLIVGNNAFPTIN